MSDPGEMLGAWLSEDAQNRFYALLLLALTAIIPVSKIYNNSLEKIDAHPHSQHVGAAMQSIRPGDREGGGGCQDRP